MSFTDSPCVQYCLYNYEKDYCEGCGRNLLEITDWDQYSDNKKTLIVEDSRKRLGKVK